MRMHSGRGSRTALGLLLWTALGACGGGRSDGPAAPSVFSPSFPASDLRLETSAPGAIDDIDPQVCANGLNVYVIWVELRVGPTTYKVWFTRSADGGLTWLPAPIDLTPTIPNSVQAVSPRIVCDGPYLYVVWADSRSGTFDIYCSRSPDGGITWPSTELRVDHNSPGNGLSWKPQVRCSGLNVYVAWLDRRGNGSDEDLYFNRSTDGGATWQPVDTKLNDSTGGLANNTEFAFDATGSLICAAWTDFRSGNSDIYADRSPDGGITWRPADIRIDSAGAGIGSSFPIVKCSASAIVAAWHDNRTGAQNHIYENRSLDGGATWRATDLRLDPALAAGSFSGSLALVGLDAYYVFPNDGRIWFIRSSDGGETWSAETRIDREPGAAKGSFGPQIRHALGELFVVWLDTRNGLNDLYFTYSLDAGTSWPPTDIRLDTDLPAGGFNSFSPVSYADAHRFYCVWFDYRNVKPDIYFTFAGP